MGTDRSDRDARGRARDGEDVDAADPLAVTVAGGTDPLAVTAAGGAAGEAPAIAPGERLGRYIVDAPLGHGGMGVVYAAHDPDLDRPVAIKVLRRELRAARARLLREGQAVARLNHPNVITVHDVGSHGDDLFIAMERVHGETLGAWIRGGTDRRRPWREVLAKLVPAGRGLVAAHAAGLVHRDFKPENVLLDDDGRVVVTDFGLAQVGDEPVPPLPPGARPTTPPPVGVDLTHTGAVLGTPAYMSPEQARGERADPRSDQFSFCVTLHEALYGARPFDASHAPTAGGLPTLDHLASGPDPGRSTRTAGARDVPRWLRRAIARGLAPEPEDRFPSMAALLDALAPPRRYGWYAAGAAVALASAAAIIALATRAPGAAPARRCDEVAAEIDQVWNPARRAELVARRAGQPSVAGEAGWLDDYAARWRTARRAACATTDATARSRTEACLDAARAGLEASLARPGDQWLPLHALEACVDGEPRALTFPPTVAVGPQGVAVLSPDGREIAVSSFAGEPYVIPADPRAVEQRTVTGARLVGDWLADGRLLVQRPDGTQVLRGPAGETALPGLGDLLHTQINTASPDGTRLAIAGDDGIAIVDAGGARLALVAGPAHEVAWAPDGRRVAVVSRDLSFLTVVDPARATQVRHALGVHARQLGEIGLAWLDPDRLVLSGAIGRDAEYGVWTVELDAASAIRRAPTVRYRAAAGQLLRVFDAGAGRVLLYAASGRQRLLRWRDGRLTEYPSHFKDVRILAHDRATGTVLGLGRDQLLRFDVDGNGRTSVAAKDALFALAGLRGGGAYQARATGAGAWELVERRADGDGRRIPFTWPRDAGTPLVRCAPAASERCAIISRGGDVLDLAALTGDVVGAPVRVKGITGLADLTADGRAIAFATGARVVTIDLATGRTTELARTGQAACTGRWVREDPVDAGLWVVLLCADRFAVGRVAPGEPYREVAQSDGWISGLEVVGGSDLVYSAMDWDPQLMLLDGL